MNARYRSIAGSVPLKLPFRVHRVSSRPAAPSHHQGRQTCVAAAQTSGTQFKQSLQQGQPKFGVFMNSGSVLAAEQLSCSGYDWILVDLQHAPVPREHMGYMLSAIDNGSAKPFVRIAGPEDRDGIQQALDLGAHGIVVPSVNTRAEVEAAMSAVFYPPAGTRSIFYPLRAMNRTGLVPYLKEANREILVAIQVETAACMENLEDVLSVPGIDIAFVGPIDLCYSLGLHQKYGIGEMFDAPELKECIEKLLRVCKERGIIPGNYAFPADRAGPLLEQGFPFLATCNDLQLLLSATTQDIKTLKAEVKKQGKQWQPRPSAMVPS